MSWLSKREKLNPKQASAIDFAVTRDGNFYVSGEAGTCGIYYHARHESFAQFQA